MYKEVALVIDCSDKPAGAFYSMLGFAQSIAYNFAYLGQNLVRLAAVCYSDATTVNFNLNWNVPWYDWVNNPLNNIAYTGGKSNLSAALDLLRTSVFSNAITRPGVPTVAIVITDNLPTSADVDTLRTALTKVTDAGIRLAVVKIIGNTKTDETVDELWENTDEVFAISVKDYNQLGDFLPTVMNFCCKNSCESNRWYD